MMIIVFSDLYFVVKLWFKYDRYLVFLYKLIGYNFMYMYYWYLNLKKKRKIKYLLKCIIVL